MLTRVIILGKAATRAQNKYNSKTYDRITVLVAKGRKAELQLHVAANGESLNGFVNRAIDETMEREGASSEDRKEC